MGTNYYWDVEGERGGHIGKRSAAGVYCWDCGVSLENPNGEPIYFRGRKIGNRRLDACPRCGQKREPGAHNATMVQLGFEEDPEGLPTGIAGVSRFSWDQEPEEVGTMCRLGYGLALILSEYEELLTGAEFLHILELCPIQSMEFLGMDFC